MAAEQFAPSFMSDLALASSALAYARELHRGQRRGFDEAPFILHPLEVAALLHNSGHPEPVVAAGILHDTVEKTRAELDEIHDRFGDQVAALVGAVSEDPRIECLAERKSDLRERVAGAGPHATSVYAADKVTKVRELRSRLILDRDLLRSDSRERFQFDHYRESLVMLERVTPVHPLVRQLRFELEALWRLPPGSAAFVATPRRR